MWSDKFCIAFVTVSLESKKLEACYKIAIDFLMMQHLKIIQILA